MSSYPWRCLFAVFLLAPNGLSQTYQGPLHFEVAAVKPAPRSSARPGGRGGPDTPDPLQVHLRDNSMGDLLRDAYNIETESFRLLAPKWIEEERYNVDATVPAGATRDQFRIMLQNLLIERFDLQAHHDNRTMDGYSLGIAKTGARVAVSAPGVPTPVRKVGKDKDGLPQLEPGAGATGLFPTSRGTRMSARGRSLSVLLPYLENIVKAPVIDETSLNARYDFNLTYSAEERGGAFNAALGGDAPLVPAPTDRAPDIFTALQEQLGLRLTAKKVPVDFIVVDRLNKVPIGN